MGGDHYWFQFESFSLNELLVDAIDSGRDVPIWCWSVNVSRSPCSDVLLAVVMGIREAYPI